MVGLGEARDELTEAFEALREVGSSSDHRTISPPQPRTSRSSATTGREDSPR